MEIGKSGSHFDFSETRHDISNNNYFNLTALTQTNYYN